MPAISTESDKPLVSIVVPAYNGARYLRDAVDSILNQTYPRIELIVLDDGSQDDTQKILETYGERFHWESHPNMGQSATLNKGWSMARGAILAYLSVDDLLEPHAVEQAVQVLEQHPQAPVVYGNYDLIDASGCHIRPVAAPDFDFHRLIAELEVQPGPGAFFRRQAFEFSQGWDSTLRQTPDYDFWLKVGLLGGFIHVNEVWAAFRVHADSQSYAEASPEKANEYIRVIENFFTRPDLTPEIQALKPRSVATAQVVCARAHIRAGRTTQGLHHLIQSVRCEWRTLLRPRAWKLVLSGIRYRLKRLKITA